MAFKTAPVAKAQMLIRRPVAEVFEAFVDPAVTSKFWFTKGSGRVEAGRQLTWEWEIYGASGIAKVNRVETDRRIQLDWGDEGNLTAVEWLFTSRPDAATFVVITNSVFKGSDDEIVAQAIDSTEGFTLVLAGREGLLEHNLSLHLVADHSAESAASPSP